MFLLLTLAALAAPPPSDAAYSRLFADALPELTEDARGQLVSHVQAEARSLTTQLADVPAAQVGGAPASDGVAHYLYGRVDSRLRARQMAGLETSLEQARGAVISFEAWRARSFITSGVAPKRYFGFLDAQGDSAELELRVVRAVRASTDACNVWLAEQGIPWRVTDQEIAITWIAEGGALLLSTDQANADRVHPILGVGLDDIAHGFRELPGLVERVDAAAGTGVAGIPQWVDGDWSLSRHMTLEESVVGTSIMWVWEKRIADRKLLEGGRPAIQTFDAQDQFILASLVYNSGLIHAPNRPGQVRRYELAEHLAAIARKHNGQRAYLPVQKPGANLTHLVQHGDAPEQPTSWIALYHILQRYGGFEAVSRYSDAFDERGHFRMERWQALSVRLAVEAEAAALGPPMSVEAPTKQEVCGGCSAHHGVPTLWAWGVPLALAMRRRGRVS